MTPQSNSPVQCHAGRRLMMTAFLCTLLSFCLPWAEAFAAEIAILKSSDIAAYNQAIEGFRATFNGGAVTEYDLQGDLDKGRKLARKIRASDPALVLAVGLKAALAAKVEIIDIPVIYSMVLDPDKHDLLAPNMTGILLEVQIERQFAMMQKVLPKLKRVGVLFDPSKTASLLQDARREAKRQGIELVERQVNSEREVPAALNGLLASSLQAMWLVPDSTVLTQESLRFLLDSTLERNVPVFGFSPEFVRSGALLSLSVMYKDSGQQAGQLAGRILRGQVSFPQKPLGPEKVTTALNFKTARFLGIPIPEDIERLADIRY